MNERFGMEATRSREQGREAKETSVYTDSNGPLGWRWMRLDRSQGAERIAANAEAADPDRSLNRG
jgi:hypothetical protein